MAVQVRAERLREMLRSPTWFTTIDGNYETADQARRSPGSRFSERPAHLFDALNDVRIQLFSATGQTMPAALEIGAKQQVPVHPAGASYSARLETGDEPLATYAHWDLWRRRNGLFFEDSSRSPET